MDELYSFDKVGEFSVVVECAENVNGDPMYEGCIYLYAIQNPHVTEQGNCGETVRRELIKVAYTLHKEEE